MATNLATTISYEDYLNDPFIEPHSEWVDGRVVTMSPVSNRHAELTAWLIETLGSYVREKGCGIVRAEPFNMKIGPSLPGRSPDILFLHKSNAKLLEKHCLRGPADLVIEVLSPESRTRDLVEKFDEYRRGGVREYWVLDPETFESKFFRLDAQQQYHEVPIDAQGRIVSNSCPGFWIEHRWLAHRPKPTAILRAWGMI